MQLTKNFTLAELTRSDIARRNNIPNAPNAAQVDNLRLLCVNVLQPVRDLFGVPVFVSSGYRSPALNRHPEIRGARNSQHQTGRAADFTIKGYTVQEVFEKIIASDILFDQIIQEFDRWVHISFAPNPRRQALVATRKDKKVKYSIYKK